MVRQCNDDLKTYLREIAPTEENRGGDEGSNLYLVLLTQTETIKLHYYNRNDIYSAVDALRPYCRYALCMKNPKKHSRFVPNIVIQHCRKLSMTTQPIHPYNKKATE